MRARKAQLVKWFELMACTLEANFGRSSSIQTSKGLFPTKSIAHKKAREYECGSHLDPVAYAAFTRGAGIGGYYFIERLVVLEARRKTFGRIVSSDVIRLTTKK